MSFMSPAHALPLEPFDLSILPRTTHNITWSPDNELAVGCDDCIFVYVPNFALSPASHGPRSRYDGPHQYDEAALRFPVATLKSPELNRHLFEAVNQDFAGYAFFTGGGSGVISGHGSSLNHTVSLAWSPCGLGRKCRSVLAVLTGAGIVTVYCQGAPGAVESSGNRARTMKPWIPAWHVGAGLLVPAIEGHAAPDRKEYITAFSWAQDTGEGTFILSYLNNDHEVVLLSVWAKHDANARPGDPGKWKVQEVARFQAQGPHSTQDDMTDPDYAYSSSSFALSWGPWVKRGNKLISMLSYVAHNYIGFRHITLERDEEKQKPTIISVGRADVSGVCLYLSTDAFVVWEDEICSTPTSEVCRGVIASPMKVQAFELSFDHESPLMEHSTDRCGTTYPSEEDVVHMGNPITGLIIHPAVFSHNAPTPSYTLVRLSAAYNSPNWHQTNLVLPPNPDDPEHDSIRWAQEIRQIIEHQLPLVLARQQIGATRERGRGQNGYMSDEEDSESDSESDADFDPEADAKAGIFGLQGVDFGDPVFLHRVRIWGLAASPGGGTSAVFVSLHSTLGLERDTFAGLKCRILFGSHPRPAPGFPQNASTSPASSAVGHLSTEAKAWEWMYGGGPDVPGFNLPPTRLGDDHMALREHFAMIARQEQCVFCKLPLHGMGNSSYCDNGHVFENCANTGVPVTAPNVSHTCGVCGMKCLKSEELLRMAPQLREIIKGDISAEMCGGCGGKFTV